MSPLLRYPLFLPRIFWLCVRYHAMPSIITHANPALPFGGLPFGPKHIVFELFDAVLPYAFLPIEWSVVMRIESARSFVAEQGYPVILKPDVGHRGVDVHRADNEIELVRLVEAQTWDYVVQRYSQLAAEYGIFYCRMLGSASGEIISLIHKVIPVLTGDGIATIAELIDRSDIHNKEAVAAALRQRLEEVSLSGETIQTLVGAAHAAGSMYFNAKERETVALRRRIDAICGFDGFYFGRLDVKADGPEALSRGEFEIIEVNGSTSECIHVYDSRIAFLDGLRILNNQWDRLFRIAAAHRNGGIHLGMRDIVRRYKQFYRATRVATAMETTNGWK